VDFLIKNPRRFISVTEYNQFALPEFRISPGGYFRSFFGAGFPRDVRLFYFHFRANSAMYSENFCPDEKKQKKNFMGALIATLCQGVPASA
jgi:hypothetical protein